MHMYFCGGIETMGGKVSHCSPNRRRKASKYPYAPHPCHELSDTSNALTISLEFIKTKLANSFCRIQAVGSAGGSSTFFFAMVLLKLVLVLDVLAS